MWARVDRIFARPWRFILPLVCDIIFRCSGFLNDLLNAHTLDSLMIHANRVWRLLKTFFPSRALFPDEMANFSLSHNFLLIQNTNPRKTTWKQPRSGKFHEWVMIGWAARLLWFRAEKSKVIKSWRISESSYLSAGLLGLLMRHHKKLLLSQRFSVAQNWTVRGHLNDEHSPECNKIHLTTSSNRWPDTASQPLNKLLTG